MGDLGGLGAVGGEGSHDLGGVAVAPGGAVGRRRGGRATGAVLAPAAVGAHVGGPAGDGDAGHGDSSSSETHLDGLKMY